MITKRINRRLQSWWYLSIKSRFPRIAFQINRFFSLGSLILLSDCMVDIYGRFSFHNFPHRCVCLFGRDGELKLLNIEFQLIDHRSEHGAPQAEYLMFGTIYKCFQIFWFESQKSFSCSICYSAKSKAKLPFLSIKNRRKTEQVTYLRLRLQHVLWNLRNVAS